MDNKLNYDSALMKTRDYEELQGIIKDEGDASWTSYQIPHVNQWRPV